MTNCIPENEGFAWLVTDLETNAYHMRISEQDAFEFAQILGGEPFRENVRCPTPNLRLFGRNEKGEPETRVIMTLEPLWWARRLVYGNG